MLHDTVAYYIHAIKRYFVWLNSMLVNFRFNWIGKALKIIMANMSNDEDYDVNDDYGDRE